MTNDVRADALLDVWFGDATSGPEAARERSKTWFQSDRSFDDRLRSRFGDLPYRLLAGEFPHWAHSPRRALARIIALDQIPRNIYRGTAAAFMFDAPAQAAAIEAVSRNFDDALHPLEAVFVYLPFEHAEDAQLQRRSVELFTRLRKRAPAGNADLFDSYLDYAHRHADVIERFSRFPHRNSTIGRAATAAENAYLANGGQRF